MNVCQLLNGILPDAVYFVYLCIFEKIGIIPSFSEGCTNVGYSACKLYIKERTMAEIHRRRGIGRLFRVWYLASIELWG